MNKELKDWIAGTPKMATLFASACGTIKVMLGERSGDPAFAKGPDMGDVIAEAVAGVLASVRTDKTAWPHVKDKMKYDEYLEAREQRGTVSEYDLVRPGLSEKDFTTVFKYFSHYERVHNDRKSTAALTGRGEKQCTKCGEAKPISKFKSGCVCNACRARAYRANVAKRQVEEAHYESQ